MGEVEITDKQGDYFNLKSRSLLSPKLENNALIVCANQSYQTSESDLLALTGIKIYHSTLQRLVNKQDLPLPSSSVGVQ